MLHLIEKNTHVDLNQAVINLSCQNLDDTQVEGICQKLKGNPRVHSLLLNWNTLSDQGAYRIAELMRTNKNLERVELAGNPAITETCIQALHSEFNERFSNKQGLRRLALNPYHGLKQIKEVCDITPEAFLRDYYNAKQPIVVRGAIKDTIAAKKWTPEYFQQVLKDKEVSLSLWQPANAINNQYYELKKIKLTIQKMMDLFTNETTLNSLTGRVYLQKQPLHEFAEIHDQIALPAFCSLIDFTKFPAHLWCGQNDTLTQLHFDELDNIFLQIHGQKSVTLFSPEDTPFLFQHRPDKHIWLRNAHRSQIPGTDQLDDYAPVHRQATPYHVHMREGDALFIPKHWWHEVRGLAGPSISVNYWFHTHPDYLPEFEELFTSEWMSHDIPAKKSIIIQATTLLLQHDCPNYVFGRMPFTMMQVAIRFNMVEVVEQLLSHPKTELYQTPFYCTPLMLAIVFEHLDSLNVLLKNKTIIDSINNEFPGYGGTPLTLATELGHTDIIKQLIACGAK